MGRGTLTLDRRVDLPLHGVVAAGRSAAVGGAVVNAAGLPCRLCAQTCWPTVLSHSSGCPLQAAGRLRKLGRGQTLRTIATEDIGEKIRATAVAAAVAAARGSGSDAVSAARKAAAARPLTSRDVLQWAMANTVAATLHGVLEWAHQGLLFAASHAAPEHRLQPEQLGLEELYGSASTPAPLSVVVAEQHQRRQRPDLAADM